jgi:hypothetical protein
MDTPSLTATDITRHAQEALAGFRSLGAAETPAQFAQAVAEQAIGGFLAAMGAQITGTQADLPALASRARLSLSEVATRVVYTTDGQGRFAVRTSGTPPWGDCVALEVMREGETPWWALNLSPARARLLAHHLIEAAAQREASSDPGMACIDQQRR